MVVGGFRSFHVLVTTFGEQHGTLPPRISFPDQGPKDDRNGNICLQKNK